jgi:hypothetical protein
MKILVLLLAFLNGAYMLLDGIYVMLKGKYIGPERPGPWANLFEKWNMDVFKLGPLFIIFGIAWLIWLFAFWYQVPWAWGMGIALSILTLWYLPVGTFFSIIIIVLLFVARQKLGL